MAALQTIAQTITIGDATVYLMSNDVSNGAVYKRRLVKPTSPVLVAYVTDALRWHNEDFPTDRVSLRGVANYDIWLCGMYGMEAQSATGGGTVVPIQPASAPQRLDFYVSDTTPVKTGESSVFFSQFIGYRLQFFRGQLEQLTANDGVNSYFSWNILSGEFICFGAANAGEPFSLVPY